MIKNGISKPQSLKCNFKANCNDGEAYRLFFWWGCAIPWTTTGATMQKAVLSSQRVVRKTLKLTHAKIAKTKAELVLLEKMAKELEQMDSDLSVLTTQQTPKSKTSKKR